MTSRCLVLIAIVLAACSARIPYQPRNDVLTGLDAEAQRRAFAESLSRAIKPRIGGVWLSDDGFTFDYQRIVRDGFGIPVAAVSEHDVGIYFANIAQLDLYTNNAVFIVGTNGQVLFKVVFGSRSDAESFIDTASALKARRLADGS